MDLLDMTDSFPLPPSEALYLSMSEPFFVFNRLLSDDEHAQVVDYITTQAMLPAHEGEET